MKFFPDLFSIKTAWRDARNQLGTLTLYSTGIIAGVAALVAILSFRSDVFLTVDDQARELLGADLQIAMNEAFPDRVEAFVDSLGGERSNLIEFGSMVVYNDMTQTRLSQIRGIEGGFPFYGTIKTRPESAAFTYQEDGMALIDRPVAVEFKVEPGDSIRIGNRWVEVAGIILEYPGESAAFSLIGPRVVVPQEVVINNNLLDRGSRIRHLSYLKFDDERDTAAIVREARPLRADQSLTFTTVESRKQDFGEIVNNLTRFLGVIGFIALLLGGLGVASAVYVYIKRKSSIVATLRCLGVSSAQTTWIFTLQVVALGLAGALLGAGIGIGIQQYLPKLFETFLPFEIVQQISYTSILTGVLVGIAVSFAFAILPIVSINSIPPLLTLRSVDFSPLSNVSKRVKTASIIGTLLILVIALGVLLDSLLAATIFILGLLISILVLLTISAISVRGVKGLRLQNLSYIWRQGISNLFRPNNQTSVMVTTLGMGMLLIGILILTQDMILDRIEYQVGDEQPDLVFYDVQADQADGIIQIAGELGGNVLYSVPIVTMRLAKIGNQTVGEIRRDTTQTIGRWALTREYRVSYRNSLTDAETILDGEWIGTWDGEGHVPVSMDYRLTDELFLSIGDSLTFDVQGVPIDVYIASIREVDFQRPQPNFFLLFPEGVLEPAPQFFATLINTRDPDITASIQQAVVAAYPNVSAIDVGLVLETVKTFLDKIALAVQFMALFSIITGLIIMASAISISRFQRLKESALLRTIGASKYQIRGIQTVEYIWLGALACIVGLGLALVASWLIAWFYFDLAFVPSFTSLALIALAVISITLFVGFLNMRGVITKKPIDILRAEVG